MSCFKNVNIIKKQEVSLKRYSDKAKLLALA
jgi:hypothetical protein